MKLGRFDIDRRRALEIAWRAGVFVVAVAILLVVTTRWNRWQGAAGWQTTDDAYLQADLTPIAAKVPGYVRFMPVQDFDRVSAGQLVAQIVDDDYRAAVAQAVANVAAAGAQIDALKAQQALQAANVAAAKAVTAGTSANLEQNARDIARQRRLFKTGSSTTEAAEKLADSPRTAVRAARPESRPDGRRGAPDQRPSRRSRPRPKRPWRRSRPPCRQPSINLAYTRITAPVDGVVGQRQIRPGQYVGVGGQITTLTPLPHVWVIANYKETQLTHMAVGEKAEIRVDTYPGHVLKGHVQAFAPGSGAQFALLPPDNATGNFTKVVQRVAVKIVIDDADGLADRLRPGLSVVARIDARDGRRQ